MIYKAISIFWRPSWIFTSSEGHRGQKNPGFGFLAFLVHNQHNKTIKSFYPDESHGFTQQSRLLFKMLTSFYAKYLYIMWLMAYEIKIDSLIKKKTNLLSPETYFMFNS